MDARGGRVKAAVPIGGRCYIRAGSSNEPSGGPWDRPRRGQMPTFIRLTVALIVIAIVGGAAMWALATFVEPKQREIVIPVPIEQPGA